jgi:hypothetical protein
VGGHGHTDGISEFQLAAENSRLRTENVLLACDNDELRDELRAARAVCAVTAAALRDGGRLRERRAARAVWPVGAG